MPSASHALKKLWHQLSQAVRLGYSECSAKEMTRAVKKCSESVSTRQSKRIRRFVRKFDDDVSFYNRSAHPDDVEDIIVEYFQRLDQLFFFGLLTQPARHKNPDHKVQYTMLKVQQTILEVRDGYNKDYLGKFNGNTIYIWTRDVNGNLCALEGLITTLAHEMVHAYLDLFSNNLDKRFEEWVNMDKGHGEMFCDLLYWILGKLYDWTGSEELKDSRDEAYDRWQKILDKRKANH